MHKLMLALAAPALMLAGCTTTGTTSPGTTPTTADRLAQARTWIDFAWQNYLVLKPAAELAALLYPERAAAIHEVEATIEQAFTTARAAVDVAEITAALHQAADAAGRLPGLSVGPSEAR